MLMSSLLLLFAHDVNIGPLRIAMRLLTQLIQHSEADVIARAIPLLHHIFVAHTVIKYV